jgi:hypothetical protein
MSTLLILIYVLIGFWVIELAAVVALVAHFERSQKAANRAPGGNPVDAPVQEAGRSQRPQGQAASTGRGERPARIARRAS